VLQLLPSAQAWLAFITLCALEIVLGIDNIIFISIVVAALPQSRQAALRVSGLALAMLTRIGLLFSIVWLTRLTQPWLHLGASAVSGRDLILLFGGLFLLGKSVVEIHRMLERQEPGRRVPARGGFLMLVVQIALIDIVFSLDSVFTAVGLVNDLSIMVSAIVVAILVMMWVAGSVSAFVQRNPTIKMLALAFLILIGVALVAGAFHFDIPKGYLYFAMAFAVAIELINIRVRALGSKRPGEH
jgi:predicted tellurium resistance membrane protein TerC